MIEFSGDQKTIAHSDSDIFRVLSDLRNLEQVKALIPEDKIKDFSFDTDSVSFVVDAIGKVRFEVIEREPDRLVKFNSVKLPFDISLMIELTSISETSTAMMLKVVSNLNPFMRGVVEKPIREAVDRISDALAQLPYDKI